MFDYVQFIQGIGDEIEKYGFTQCGLDTLFPRYAEFWYKYICPNRDLTDRSKLKKNTPEEWEDIFNRHYGVCFHLTFAFRQLSGLPNPLIDISTPIYHFGAAIDLVEKTLYAAIQAKSNEMDRNNNELERNKKGGTSNVLKQHIANWDSVKATFKPIQDYRNTMIHNISPLRIRLDDGTILIPKPEYLSEFADAKWSSIAHNLRDPRETSKILSKYVPYSEIVPDQASLVVQTINEVWENLLSWMTDIIPYETHDLDMRCYNSTPYYESGEIGTGFKPIPLYTVIGEVVPTNLYSQAVNIPQTKGESPGSAEFTFSDATKFATKRQVSNDEEGSTSEE